MPRGQEPRGLAAGGWGDSNSGPQSEVVPGSGCACGLSCGSLAPVVTARARCTPLPARSACTHRVPAGSGPSVADAFGAPVLRPRPEWLAAQGKPIDDLFLQVRTTTAREVHGRNTGRLIATSRPRCAKSRLDAELTRLAGSVT
jgi:hypothetical protein